MLKAIIFVVVCGEVTIEIVCKLASKFVITTVEEQWCMRSKHTHTGIYVGVHHVLLISQTM